LRRPGNPFEQRVPAGQKGDQQLIDHVFLADDRLRYRRFYARQVFGGGGGLDLKITHVWKLRSILSMALPTSTRSEELLREEIALLTRAAAAATAGFAAATPSRNASSDRSSSLTAAGLRRLSPCSRRRAARLVAPAREYAAASADRCSKGERRSTVAASRGG